MQPFETHLPVKQTGGSVVRTSLPNALANPVPVITPSTGVQVTPLPPGGLFTVPLDVLTGGGR